MPPADTIRIEPVDVRLRVELGDRTIAETADGVRVLEGTHPPVYYLPIADVAEGVLQPTAKTTFCPLKGDAAYWTVRAGDRVEVDAAWGYPDHPELAGRVAFYPGRMDACWVGDQRAEPEPGGFYGGWVIERR